MSVQAHCPYCGSPVELQTYFDKRAKCSKCLTEFDPQAPAATDVHEATQIVTFAQVGRAQMQAEKLRAENAKLLFAIRRTERQCKRRRLWRWLQDFALRSRLVFDATCTRTGAFFIMLTLGAAVPILAANFVRSSLSMHLFAMLVGVVITACAIFPLVWYPADSALVLRVAALTAELTAAQAKLELTVKTYASHRTRLKQAEAECRRLEELCSSRLNWLRTCQWRLMTGDHFEEFLAEVFRQWGYNVELTGRSGDQGIDLIVSRDGCRTAIQAKGYTSGSVGNSAVQQAHAGMTHYRCDRSAVATNSRFTVGAVELAASVGCILIDGDAIPELIDGQLAF